MRGLRRAWLYIWASPWTFVGLSVAILARMSGGRVHCQDAILECHGGAAAWLLARLPIRPSAITLGHVVLARTAADLHRTRAHERVHVRQYERWGPLFGPAYVLCSLALWLAGKDAYRDNPFERQAFREAP